MLHLDLNAQEKWFRVDFQHFHDYRECWGLRFRYHFHIHLYDFPCLRQIWNPAPSIQMIPQTDFRLMGFWRCWIWWGYGLPLRLSRTILYWKNNGFCTWASKNHQKPKVFPCSRGRRPQKPIKTNGFSMFSPPRDPSQSASQPAGQPAGQLASQPASPKVPKVWPLGP